MDNSSTKNCILWSCVANKYLYIIQSIVLVNKSFPTFEKIFQFFLPLNKLSKNQMLTIVIEDYQLITEWIPESFFAMFMKNINRRCDNCHFKTPLHSRWYFSIIIMIHAPIKSYDILHFFINKMYGKLSLKLQSITNFLAAFIISYLFLCNFTAIDQGNWLKNLILLQSLELIDWLQ